MLGSYGLFSCLIGWCIFQLDELYIWPFLQANNTELIEEGLTIGPTFIIMLFMRLLESRRKLLPNLRRVIDVLKNESWQTWPYCIYEQIISLTDNGEIKPQHSQRSQQSSFNSSSLLTRQFWI